MQPKNYWHNARLTRRRVLAVSGSTALGAAFLAACGGKDTGTSGPTPNSSLYVPKDTLAQAVKGGVYTEPQGNIAAFDTLGNATDSTAALHGYSRMVKYKVYKYPEKALPVVEPDGMASWEASPDGLTHTFKVKPLKYDPRPPTSGRTMTSADVKFSWDRYAKLNPFRVQLANEADPNAPVTNVSTPDPSTVVFKLSIPYGPFLPVLAYNRSLAIMPVEADGKYDVKNDIRGTGPWRLKEFIPSSRVSYEPNPDWYDAAKMNFAGITYYNIPEYSAIVSQFRAGNLAKAEIQQQDVLSIKRDQPQVRMKPVDGFELAHNSVRFGYKPGSPFLDERVRKATSMLLDRDLIIETMNETKRFKDAGFDIEQRWNSALICGEQWWMNPKSKDLGPDAKVYTYDPAEAKKLLRAAGHTSALKSVFGIRNEQPNEYEREAQIMHGMWTAHGDFDLQFQVRDYRSDWRDKVHFGSNQHDGIAFGFFQSTFPDVDLVLLAWYLSGQQRTGHLDASGKPDATMDGLILKQRTERDINKRTDILNDFQRYAAKTMYTYMGAGDSTRFELGQPWLGNWGMYRTSATESGAPATEVFPYLYINKQAAP